MILAFWIGSALGWALVVLAAKMQRGGLYARFAAVLVGIHTLLSCSLAKHVGPLLLPYAFLQLAVYLHFFFLARPKMRSFAYRVLISLPASFFAASTFLALPWSLATAFGATPRALFIPYVLGLIGIVQSLTSRRGRDRPPH